MCGISGYLSYAGAARQSTVQAMCDQIRHRGPDDQGFYVEGPVGLGMRRLSIIDLAGGHQPISNEDGSVWVVFNGEIYNYQALRQDLLSRGHRFRTDSDTETLVHLYEEFGADFVTRLRGMFAFAIWDSNERRMLLARDRLGKKPLYYAETAEGFFFGSELKCLRAAGVPLEQDDEAMRLYLQFAYIPDPYSAFRGIRKLPAGCTLTVRSDRGSDRLKVHRYWSVPEPCGDPGIDLSEDVVCDEIRNVFDESVRLRMIADVPLGAFLSGGIDSGLVVASMARQSDRPVKTFSIGFNHQQYNELPLARLVAAKYRTEHRELVVEPDAVGLVPQLVRQFDEPFADASSIPTFLVSRFAAEHVKVALSGDGGDEFFGGYPDFFEAGRNRRFDAIPRPVRAALSAIADGLPYSAYGKNYLRMASRPSALERFIETISPSSYFLRAQVLDAHWMLPQDAASLKHFFGDAILDQTRDPVSQAMQFRAVANLTGDMLVKVDRMSMANSLEVRCPLLDHVLAEVANRIPNAWKISNGKGKQILLKALGDRLPPELLSAPKRGFGVPLDTWMRGPLREMVRDTLLSAKARQRGITNGRKVEEMIEEHQSGRRDNSFFLYLLIVLELWLLEYATPAAPVVELFGASRA
jgi:asparagine synthase (glutamine-hydrolysing)